MSTAEACFPAKRRGIPKGKEKEENEENIVRSSVSFVAINLLESRTESNR